MIKKKKKKILLENMGPEPCFSIYWNTLKYSRNVESMLGGSLVTTAWRVLRLRMEGSPPGTEGSCEYIE
jgi:hypothetical protein